MTDEVDVWEEAERTRRRTETENRATVQLWLDGLNLLSDNLQPLRGHQYSNPERDVVLIALLIHALNTQLAGYQLAADGYCPQAVVLVRICVEHWLAFWYVKNFPEDASRFLRHGDKRAPDWNHMVQRLTSKHGASVTASLEGWRQWLSKIGHVDPVSVRSTFSVSDTTTWMRLGPHYDSDLFADCAGELMQVLPPLLEASQALCGLLALTPARPAAAEDYLTRLMLWLQERLGADPAGGAGAGTTSQS